MRQLPKRRQLFALLSSLLFLTGCVLNNDASPDATFLAPYINLLKQETPPKTLHEILALPRSELARIHFGYGTRIRNKWLWGEQDPDLIAYFKSKGVTHPDTMSSKIIEALWENLNQEIPAEQMIAIEKQREVHLKKQTIFERISVECTKQILLKRPAIDRCYASYSLALQPLSNRPIFDELEISSKGMIQRISHPKHTSR